MISFKIYFLQINLLFLFDSLFIFYYDWRSYSVYCGLWRIWSSFLDDWKMWITLFSLEWFVDLELICIMDCNVLIRWRTSSSFINRNRTSICSYFYGYVWKGLYRVYICIGYNCLFTVWNRMIMITIQLIWILWLKLLIHYN